MRILNELNSEKYPIYYGSVPEGKTSVLRPVTAEELRTMYTDEDDIAFLRRVGNDDLFLITPDNANNIELEKVSRDYVIDATKNKIYLVGGFSRNDETIVYEYRQIVRLYNSTYGVQEETHLLPSAYTQVEYIGLDNTSPCTTYIVTQISVSNISKVICEYSYNNFNSGNSPMFLCVEPKSGIWACTNGAVSRQFIGFSG